mgnify:CR=1 FL=1
MIAQADSRKWMACLYNSFLFMEAKIMKMAKKLLAVVLTGVMAVSMLTGCAVGDKIKENALVDALNYEGKKETSIVKYEEGTKANDTAKTSLTEAMTAAKNAVKALDDTSTAADVENVTISTPTGFTVAVKEIPSKATKQDSWSKIATDLHTTLKTAAHKGGSKNDTIVVNIDFISKKVTDGSKKVEKDFVIVVAKNV